MRFSFQLNFMSSLLFFVHGLMCWYLLANNYIGAAQVTVILGYTILATNTLQMFFEWFSQFEEALTGVEKMDEYIRLPLEQGMKLPSYSDFSSPYNPRLSPLYHQSWC